MYIHPFRRLLRTVGLDVHRYHPSPDRLTWVCSMNIESVIDVGANVGQSAILFRSYLPKAYIYSFEPVQESFKNLEHTMRGDKNFSAYQLAFGDINGTLSIHRSDYSLTSSLLPMEQLHTESLGHAHNLEDEIVAVQRMDDFFSGNLHIGGEILVKIDAEGYERAVIEGGRRTLLQVKALVIENSYVPRYTGQSLFEDLYPILLSLGFYYAGSLTQKLHPHTGEILFEDSLFIRR